MNKMKVALAALSFVAMSANAAALKTQYFYQTDTDKNAVTPEYDYNDQTINYNGGDKDELSGFSNLKVTYERGLSDMFSVGIAVPYQVSGTDKSTGGVNQSVKGLGDIDIYAKGTYALADDMNLHFGLGIHWGLAKLTFNNTSYNADDNRFALVPYIGYVYNLGGFTLGAKLSFDLGIVKAKWQDNVDVPNQSLNVSGGDTTKATIFGELPFSGGLAGLAVSYRAISMHKETAGGPTINAEDGLNWIDFDLYATYEVADGITIIPAFGYSILENSYVANNQVSNGNDVRASLQGRFTF